MKKSVKINTLFQILVLYCFIVSIYSAGISTTSISVKHNQLTQSESYFQVSDNILFNLTTKTENVVNSAGPLYSFSLNHHFNGFGTSRHTAELFIINACSKYLFYARNSIERFEQPDIIFPFHYFW